MPTPEFYTSVYGINPNLVSARQLLGLDPQTGMPVAQDNTGLGYRSPSASALASNTSSSITNPTGQVGGTSAASIIQDLGNVPNQVPTNENTNQIIASIRAKYQTMKDAENRRLASSGLAGSGMVTDQMRKIDEAMQNEIDRAMAQAQTTNAQLRQQSAMSRYQVLSGQQQLQNNENQFAARTGQGAMLLTPRHRANEDGGDSLFGPGNYIGLDGVTSVLNGEQRRQQLYDETVANQTKDGGFLSNNYRWNPADAPAKTVASSGPASSMFSLEPNVSEPMVQNQPLTLDVPSGGSSPSLEDTFNAAYNNQPAPASWDPVVAEAQAEKARTNPRRTNRYQNILGGNTYIGNKAMAARTS